MFVHRSNSLEELVDRLSEVLERPLPGLLEPEIVLIQSAGMERFLSRELSRRQSILANARFPFPRVFLRDVLDRCLGADERSVMYEREAMAWRLYELLRDLSGFAPSEHLAMVKKHLSDDRDGSKRLLLAEQLAHLFDQYVTYRPRMVLKWEREPNATDFQAILWKQLTERVGDAHFAARAATFLNEVEDEDLRAVLPRRICVMGGPGLPPLFLQLLARLGRAIEVHVFSFSVCQEYFADAHPLDDPLPDLGQGLHPLLLSLGKVGADYQHLIEMVGEYEEGNACFHISNEPTLLAALQRGLVRGRLTVAETPAHAADGSITVESCHSRLREIEILHDRLLAWFNADPTLRPEDIVVLAPDVEVYSPLIDAVFSARGDQRAAIPFRVADRSERSTNAAARAVLLALGLLPGRFKASQLLDLLQLEPVRARYGIDLAGLERVQDWIRKAGIRWGVDAEHRTEYGLPADDRNTWRFGLDRLLLGYALFDDDAQLFGGSVPVDDVAPGEAELLGNLVEFCEALFDLRRRAHRAKGEGLTLVEWESFLLDLLSAVVAESAEGAWDKEAVRRALLEIRVLREPFTFVEAAADDSDRVRRADVVRAESRTGLSGIERMVSAALEANRPSTDFLAGGVTFCALLPLRTIPFRRVCVLGMNQGEFPRHDVHHELNLMSLSPRRGDRSLRADDRYLFLEVLLAARECLALSYIGRSVQDNTEKPPSVVLEELRSVVARMCPTELGICVVSHPLQPFHPSYFSATLPQRCASDAKRETGGAERGEVPRSFDQSCYRGARSLLNPAQPIAPFYSLTDDQRQNVQSEQNIPLEMTLTELVRFWKNPSAAYLAAHGVYVDDEVEQLEDREPVVEDALLRYQVGQHALTALIEGRQIRGDITMRRGDLPVGQGGRELLACVEEIAVQIGARVHAYTQEPMRPAQSLQLIVGEALDPRVVALLKQDPTFAYPSCLPAAVVLEGSVDHIYGRLRVEMSYGQINVGRMLALWINHLAACASGAGIERSILVGRAAAGERDLYDELQLTALPRQQAESQLSELCQLAVLGRHVPLRFFPQASLIYFETLAQPPQRMTEEVLVQRAIDKARGLLSSRAGVADSDPYRIGELYRGVDPLALDQCEADDFSESSFALFAEFVFGPIFRAMYDKADAPPDLRVIPGGKA